MWSQSEARLQSKARSSPLLPSLSDGRGWRWGQRLLRRLRGRWRRDHGLLGRSELGEEAARSRASRRRGFRRSRRLPLRMPNLRGRCEPSRQSLSPTVGEFGVAVAEGRVVIGMGKKRNREAVEGSRRETFFVSNIVVGDCLLRP